MRISIGSSVSNKISLEQKSGLLQAIKTDNYKYLVKYFAELEYRSVDEDRRLFGNRRRKRVKKLEEIIAKAAADKTSPIYDDSSSLYSSHENYKKEQWRLVQRRVFKMLGYTTDQFKHQQNRFWVSNYGRLLYFDNLDTNNPTLQLCTERPNINDNYVSSRFPNINPDPSNGQDSNYIKYLRVRRSHVVFFTFYKWHKFNNDTMDIDHINGDKSDNHFINLWILTKDSNKKVRDKLNRNNGIYGTNAISKGGEEEDGDGIPKDILWIKKPTPKGSTTPATGFVVCKSGIVGAIRKRARMEVEAGHFDELSCNHILYMFFKRRDLYVLKEKFFDKTYLISNEAASNNDENGDNNSEGEDEQQQQQQQQQQPRRQRGGTASREDTNAAQNDLTPHNPSVTPGSATAQQSRRDGGGSTLTRVRVTIGRRTVYPDRSNDGAPTPQLLFTRNDEPPPPRDDGGEEPPPPGEEIEEEEDGPIIGDLLTLNKHEHTIDRGDNNSSWRGRNSIFHVLYHQLNKIGKLSSNFNGLLLKENIANFVRDFENQPLTYEKNKIHEFIAKQKDTQDAKYNKVKYVNDLLHGRDGSSGGNVSGSAGAVIEGFITSVLYNVTVVYWYPDIDSGEITQYNKWDAAYGGSEILHVFSEDNSIGNTSYCPMYISQRNQANTGQNAINHLHYQYVEDNLLDEREFMDADHVQDRIDSELFRMLEVGNRIVLIESNTIYRIKQISGRTVSGRIYTLEKSNDESSSDESSSDEEEEKIVKVKEIHCLMNCLFCEEDRAEDGTLGRSLDGCLTCPTPFCRACIEMYKEKLVHVKCTNGHWRFQCRRCQSQEPLPIELRRQFPQDNQVKLNIDGVKTDAKMDDPFSECPVFSNLAELIYEKPLNDLTFEYNGRAICLEDDTPESIGMLEGRVESISVRENNDSEDSQDTETNGTCRLCVRNNILVHKCKKCNGDHCTSCLGNVVDNLCPSCELFNRITPGTTRVEYDHPDHSLIRGNVLEKELHADGTFSEVKIEHPTDLGYMVALCNPAWLRVLGRFDEEDDDDLPPDDGNNNNGDDGEGGGKSNYSGQSGGEAEGDDNVDEGGNGSDNEGGNGSENEDGSIGGASEGGEDANTGTENLSEYELARLQRIARNKARLKALGLGTKKQDNSPKKTQRKRKPKDPVSPSRVSKRLKGLEPDGKTIISKDTSEDTSSRPPVQEQQSLLPISDNKYDGSEYTQADLDLSYCSEEEGENDRPRKRSRRQQHWELPFSQLQDIEDDDGTELELWKRMFKQLVKYKSEHDNASPSLNSSENKELATWTYEQRIICNDGMLDKTRRECLLLIGFILKSTANGVPLNVEKNTNKWNKRYNELVEYNKVNGTVHLPQTLATQKEVPEGWTRQLALWVMTQRIKYKAEKLTPEQIEKLNEIGFEWEVQLGWDERFQQLTEYKEQNGHCRVPKGYKDNPQLANWVMSQRKAKKKLGIGKITEEQINLLDEIGFEWVLVQKQVSWDERFEQLVQYKQVNGHSNVPKIYNANPPLGEWVHRQRAIYNNKRKDQKLSSDQISLLNGIGFSWNRLEEVWNERFKQLTEYKEQNGHCRVPQKYKDNPKLGSWVNEQRTKYRKNQDGKTITEERIRRLERLGFEWVLGRRPLFNGRSESIEGKKKPPPVQKVAKALGMPLVSGELEEAATTKKRKKKAKKPSSRATGNYSPYEAFYGQVPKLAPQNFLSPNLLHLCQSEDGSNAAYELVKSSNGEATDEDIKSAIEQGEKAYEEFIVSLSASPKGKRSLPEGSTNTTACQDTSTTRGPPPPQFGNDPKLTEVTGNLL